MSLQPIKVLHLIPTLSSGGGERQLVNLVSSTSKEIVNHIVCVIGEADFFAPNIREAGCKVIEFEIFAKHSFLKAASKFRRIVREEKPDIIHSWLYDANVSARLGNLLNGKTPIVTSLQSSDYSPEARRAGNWNPRKVYALRMIDKFTARLTKLYFVPCSESVKNSYRLYYGIDESKTQVIYNSVNLNLLATSEDDLKKLRRELALPADAFIYLNVGRLDKPKNHKILIEAFQKVALEIPNAYLLIAGAGDLENKLKEQAKDAKISEKVLFLGRRNDIGVLLEIADVFVFPSLLEGLPVALVEAMFKSLPCIASRIEVFEEVVTNGETGLLINPASADELKDAMIELHKNEARRKSLGENAFQQARAKFNTTVTAGQWEKFYQKVKSESKTP
ncbi:MAG: glycosyltransferase [Acidobacteria bacterium]|nr:glycosyltransferase [Acidobacteriota bacterium]